ncbi:hypothetical protein BpHYR1_042514 [Brachionus plicatilis]|uniref:Uncharacterized protein n=1 Tax=Brachionus plicatilis TaxID=10195 RepID=A0A3M7SX08_BRAPC|nr:hypothetical protein BpHYR1_042514 [Brachionus plicatilis]
MCFRPTPKQLNLFLNDALTLYMILRKIILFCIKNTKTFKIIVVEMALIFIFAHLTQNKIH